MYCGHMDMRVCVFDEYVCEERGLHGTLRPLEHEEHDTEHGDGRWTNDARFDNDTATPNSIYTIVYSTL